MADVKRYEYPFTDLEPGTYRYQAASWAEVLTVTVERRDRLYAGKADDMVVSYKGNTTPLPSGVPKSAVFEEISGT